MEFKMGGGSEKDDTEIELEKLVFGDSAGFREGLRDFAIDKQQDYDQAAGESAAGLEGLDDADVGQNIFMTAFISLGAKCIIVVFHGCQSSAGSIPSCIVPFGR